MDLEAIKKLIKENIEIRVTTESGGSECTYSESTYVELIFDGEVVSKDEIQKISEDY